MSKFNKEYIIPLQSKEDKQKIRDWVGTHNGMSILKSDWRYTPHDISVYAIDTYILGISNPKTEMLFLLTFPEAIEKDKLKRVENQGWTFPASNKITSAI